MRWDHLRREGARWRELHRRVQPVVSVLALLGGFVWDALTLVRVDQPLDNLFIGAYAAMLGILLVLEHRVASEPERWPRLARRHDVLVYGRQFFFGGLLSACLVFYGRAASLGPSAVFIGVLATLLVINELLPGLLRRTWLKLGLYWLGVFAWLLFFVPVQLGYPGRALLVVAAVLATGPALLVTRGMFAALPTEVRRTRVRQHLALFAGLGVLMASLDAAGLIPPVPLAALEMGIFHGVERREDPEACRGTRYWLRYEQPRWYQPFKDDDRRFRWREGEEAACFTAIFVPEGMEGLAFFHVWERWDDEEGWVPSGEPWNVTTSGGPVEGRAYRATCPWGGYRTWSTRSTLTEGPWRCRLVTASGREIARVGFTVERADDAPVFAERPWD